VHRERYEVALRGHFLLATEIADWLVGRGVPFRTAHHVSGRVVGDCEARGTDFSTLDVETLRQFHDAFDADALTWLDPRTAAERRTSFGGTAPAEIRRQRDALAAWVAARS
jgi:argininosuccinate lyase